jgi:hypothetical protein
MRRQIKVLVLFFGAIAMMGVGLAQEPDAKILDRLRNGRLNPVLGAHTRDACDRAQDIVITSTTEGNLILRRGETKFFRIREQDDYTRSGGWYWKCGNSLERARIRDAKFIKAVRNDRGVTDWYEVKP